MGRVAFVGALGILLVVPGCSRKLGAYEQAMEDQRQAHCPDLKSAAECAARLEAERRAEADAADAGRLQAEKADRAAAEAKAEVERAELRALSKAEREARLRAAWTPDGHCPPQIYHAITRSTDDAAERKALAAFCMKTRNASIAALRGEVAALRRLEAEARANPGACIDPMMSRARVGALGTDVAPTGVHHLRVAVNQLRMCSCSTAVRTACDDLLKTLKSAEEELAEPQVEYCK